MAGGEGWRKQVLFILLPSENQGTGHVEEKRQSHKKKGLKAPLQDSHEPPDLQLEIQSGFGRPSLSLSVFYSLFSLLGGPIIALSSSRVRVLQFSA